MYLSRLNETPDASRDGGKGYNLKVLTQAGFNVPEAVIISAEFYSAHYPQPPQFSFHDDVALAQQCERFRQKIFELPLSKELEAGIALFIKELGKESRFAVRSSSTFEDLAGAAFAGQHETFLNVSPEKINEKVRLCLSSLWSPHAVLYRNHQSFSQAEVSMAVVIQRMIPGDAAGVAFSVDPVSGNLKHVLIEGNFGVGESVVGGESITLELSS
jgi:pyruvate,water dikinase